MYAYQSTLVLAANMHVPGVAVESRLSSIPVTQVQGMPSQHTCCCQMLVKGHGGRQMGSPVTTTAHRMITAKRSRTRAGCRVDRGGESEVKDALLLPLTGVTEFKVKVIQA